MFQRILVANRGEIALRVIRACRELGIEVVAVYSQADRDAPYLALADRAICIGKASSADSYLNKPRIIAAAEVADVQAIHPGYGFLSENPDFAEICRLCNFEFIGPPHEAIRQMGLKTEAKAVAAAAEVGCVPGSDGPVASNDEARRLARAIGFPVLIKAAAGGGGKGMRVCRDESSLVPSLQSARNEAEAAFKNSSVYLEKFIDRPRHVEVQILADNHGNIIHCWDRDCSLQRRHQKLVEEAPAPTLPLDVRTQLGEAAVRLARAAGYANAGTCEFLVDADNRFYFIEVNARIQVEHPVTEMVTGLDLIKQQIRIAAGEPLPLGQADVVTRGHSFECRINSEDPDHDFRPSPGRITALRLPGGPGVRWDSHIQVGYTIPPYYDSLVGKLIAGRSTNWSSRESRPPFPSTSGSSATATSSRDELTPRGWNGC
jgi:acetyl-CoA carboxylase biotin carboxylase subunit